jgi:predicted deacylase
MIDSLVAEPAAALPNPATKPGLRRDHVLAHLAHARADRPTLVVVGGLHGNEPAGIGAIERVLAVLRDEQIQLDGHFLALAGNLSALAERRRYLHRDLNRAWVSEQIAAVRRQDPASWQPEDREQQELLALFEDLVANAKGPLFILDLHTTSGQGVPFGNMADTLRNRSFALAVPVPVIVGLEEELAGTMLDYLESMGFITLGFEGGQHDEPSSVDHSEAALWIALRSAGLLPAAARPHAERASALLAQVTQALPRLLEVRYRHAITAADEFVMDPGYTNFQPVRRGQAIARDRRGVVKSPETARLLMPLYQKLGDDGFFLIRGFHPIWLGISTACRRLRLDRIVRLLPGIKSVPDHPESVDVDQRVARWFALEIFHLLGYRRQRREGSRVILSRRLEHGDRRRSG